MSEAAIFWTVATVAGFGFLCLLVLIAWVVWDDVQATRKLREVATLEDQYRLPAFDPRAAR